MNSVAVCSINEGADCNILACKIVEGCHIEKSSQKYGLVPSGNYTKIG